MILFFLMMSTTKLSVAENLVSVKQTPSFVLGSVAGSQVKTVLFDCSLCLFSKGFAPSDIEELRNPSLNDCEVGPGAWIGDFESKKKDEAK
jgi:hypothetical protein